MKGKKVLLVDDEVEFVTTLAERLRLREIEVETAVDGETALRLVAAAPPDIVILDLKMPGMSGLEVLRQLKKDQPRIQVILLTGHGSTREGIEGMTLGAFDYLIKPINIEELILKMQDAVGDH